MLSSVNLRSDIFFEVIYLQVKIDSNVTKLNNILVLNIHKPKLSGG